MGEDKVVSVKIKTKKGRPILIGDCAVIEYTGVFDKTLGGIWRVIKASKACNRIGIESSDGENLVAVDFPVGGIAKGQHRLVHSDRILCKVELFEG